MKDGSNASFLRLAALCFSILLIVETFDTYLFGILQIRPNISMLTILIEATVQLIGFGGIIFGISYTLQRSVIRDLREDTEAIMKLQDQMRELRGLVKMPPSPGNDALPSILKEEKAKARNAILLIRGGFSLAFLLLTIDLVLEIIHFSIYDMSYTMIWNGFSLGSELLSAETGVLAMGVTSLLLALIESAWLPSNR